MFKLNTSQLDRKVERAFNKMADRLGTEFTTAIEAPIYPWPRGESPRDIVDTGLLAKSQTQTAGRLSREYQWPREGNVSLLIHEGTVLNNGTILPARRWTDIAIAKIDPLAAFATEFGRA